MTFKNVKAHRANVKRYQVRQHLPRSFVVDKRLLRQRPIFFFWTSARNGGPKERDALASVVALVRHCLKICRLIEAVCLHDNRCPARTRTYTHTHTPHTYTHTHTHTSHVHTHPLLPSLAHAKALSHNYGHPRDTTLLVHCVPWWMQAACRCVSRRTIVIPEIGMNSIKP